MQHKFFENSFLPSIIADWNELDYSVWNAPSINVFIQNILMFIHFVPKPLKTLVINKTLDLSHLSECLSACLDEMCICGKDIESAKYFLLHCFLYIKEK